MALSAGWIRLGRMSETSTPWQQQKTKTTRRLRALWECASAVARDSHISMHSHSLRCMIINYSYVSFTCVNDTAKKVASLRRLLDLLNSLASIEDMKPRCLRAKRMGLFRGHYTASLTTILVWIKWATLPPDGSRYWRSAREQETRIHHSAYSGRCRNKTYIIYV